MSSHPRLRTSRFRRVAVAAVILVPLAFAGLFVGALPHGNDALDAIPAAVVNQDQLIYQTAADGTKTPMFAGRQLVTELTGGGAGFDWSVSNAQDADKALAAGDVDAVLTIPRDFSSSILSLSSGAPHRADLAIRTDDAHSYLTGAVAQTVGGTMVSAFGKTITERYISGMTAGIQTLGASLGTAAAGADSLADAAGSLSSGLSTLSGGVASVRGGAASLASGVDGYTSGVDGLGGGLAALRDGAAALTGLSNGVAKYTGSVAQLARILAAANTALRANPNDPVAQATFNGTVNAISGKLNSAAAGGATLSRQAAAGIGGIQTGIARSAAGAAKLSAGSPGLRSGADSLARGLDGLRTGAAGASSGASRLTAGMSDLASGLRTGADGVPASGTGAAAATVAADPVALTVTRDHEVRSGGQVAAIFFVPLGLWIGALAVFLVLRPITRRALASTAATGRLVWSSLGRAAAIAIAQALLLVGLLHLAVGVPWSYLGATLGFSVLMALAFTAFHHLLTIGFGRAGLVLSLLALAVQITATGGLYPLQLLSAPFQWLSPLLPLTYGVSGMRGIVAGGSAGPVVGAAAVLLGFGILSVLLSAFVLGSTRRAHALAQLSSASAA